MRLKLVSLLVLPVGRVTDRRPCWDLIKALEARLPLAIARARLHDVLQGLEDPLVGLVAHRPVHRPHPVAISVPVKVKQNSPLLFPPSWPTKSISTKPGTASSQSAQVRTGIWDFNNDPGLVWERSRGIGLARSLANRRSMVAALILVNNSASSSDRSSSPSARSSGTNTGKNGASRLPAGARNTAQHLINPAMTLGLRLS